MRIYNGSPNIKITNIVCLQNQNNYKYNNYIPHNNYNLIKNNPQSKNNNSRKSNIKNNIQNNNIQNNKMLNNHNIIHKDKVKQPIINNKYYNKIKQQIISKARI